MRKKERERERERERGRNRERERSYYRVCTALQLVFHAEIIQAAGRCVEQVANAAPRRTQRDHILGTPVAKRAVSVVRDSQLLAVCKGVRSECHGEISFRLQLITDFV